MFTHKQIVLIGLLTALAGCGSDNVGSEGGTRSRAGATSAGGSAVQVDAATRITIRANVENFVTFHVLPSALCALRAEGADVSTGAMQLVSDEGGAVSFGVEARAADFVERLSLSCTNGAGAATTSFVDVRSDADVAALTAPSPQGRIRPTLTNPDTLTNEELHAAGRPSRPDPTGAPEAYQRWLEYVSRPTVELATKPMAVPNRRATVNDTENWAGAAVVKSKSPYLALVGQWEVPNLTVPLNNGPVYDANVWIGVGGYGSGGGAMWQGGTDSSAQTIGNLTTYNRNFWFELIEPSNPFCCAMEILSGYPAPNPYDVIVAELWFSPVSTCGGFSGNETLGITNNNATQYLGYLFSNETQGYYYPGCVNVASYMSSVSTYRGPSGISGGSAEWIVERTDGDGAPTYMLGPLANFNNVTFSNAQACDTQCNYASNRQPQMQVMVNNEAEGFTDSDTGDVLASPSVSGSDVFVFFDQYQ